MLSSQENVQSKRNCTGGLALFIRCLWILRATAGGATMAGGRQWPGGGDERGEAFRWDGDGWGDDGGGREEAMDGGGGDVCPVLCANEPQKQVRAPPPKLVER